MKHLIGPYHHISLYISINQLQISHISHTEAFSVAHYVIVVIADKLHSSAKTVRTTSNSCKLPGVDGVDFERHYRTVKITIAPSSTEPAS